MIINLSLAEGKFPDAFKIAHVTPLFKKTSLDRNELSTIRPVSGLNFVSKLIEKIVASQIKFHMQNSGISNNLDRHLNLDIPPKQPFRIFKMTFCQTVVNYCSFAFEFVCDF